MILMVTVYLLFNYTNQQHDNQIQAESHVHRIEITHKTAPQSIMYFDHP